MMLVLLYTLQEADMLHKKWCQRNNKKCWKWVQILKPSFSKNLTAHSILDKQSSCRTLTLQKFPVFWITFIWSSTLKRDNFS